MKLYSAPGSCSTATQIAFTEAEAEFEIVKIDLFGDRTLPDGRHINDLHPKGYVPVLEIDDGQYLTENIAVLLYVADQFPGAGLAPASGTMARTRLHEWLGYINSELHKPFSFFFNASLPADMRPILASALDKRYAYVDRHLAESEYLLQGDYSVADIYLYIVSSWAPKLGYELQGANIRAWQERVGSRTAVRNVMSSLKH